MDVAPFGEGEGEKRTSLRDWSGLLGLPTNLHESPRILGLGEVVVALAGKIHGFHGLHGLRFWRW